MAEAMANAVGSEPKPYRTSAKNMQAAAETLVGIKFLRGHPDKKRFEQGMGYLNTTLIQQDTYTLSKSHAGTSGDAGGTATWQTQKSGSKD